MTPILMKHLVLVVMMICYARSSLLVILSLTLLFQGGISALYSASYGGLFVDCQYYMFIEAVVLHVNVLEGSHTRV